MEKKEIQLIDWELIFANEKAKWKVKPVPWETEITKGGTGKKDYDGIGIYLIHFPIPLEWKGEALAFYCDGIDDADEAFFNGHPIGHTGKIPKDPNKSLTDFRSAAREARLYQLTNINFGADNELQIKVYDYAGLGGFSPTQTPVIGKFQSLKERERNHRLRNDLPRTVAGSFLLVFLFTYLFNFLFLISKVKTQEVLKSILRPYKFYFRTENKKYTEFSIQTYITSRYLLSVLFCFFCLLFLLTELTYKYLIIESEEFYFKIPTLGFVLGQFTLQLLFYPDVFGFEISKKGKWVNYGLRLLFATISHPFWTVLFLGYLAFLQPNQVWNEFTIIGIVHLFLVISILFAGSALNLLQVGYSKNKLQNKKSIRSQGIIRATLFIGMLIAILIWFFSPFFYPYSFLIMILFLMGYIYISLDFISRNKILLPIEPTPTYPIFTLAQSIYGVTYNEAQIVEAIYDGLSRPEIKTKFSLTEENLKKYLNSIYKKVFKHHNDVTTTGRDKLQRLTMILHRKLDRTKHRT